MTGRSKMIVTYSALVFAWLTLLSILEGYALMQAGPDDAITISRFMFTLGNNWPPIVFLLGLTFGVLTEHFWRYIDVQDFAFGFNIPPLVRVIGLAIGWLLILVLTGGGPAIFLAGFVVGMVVTSMLWKWDPRDANDHRG